MTPDEAYEEALLRIRHAQETGAVENKIPFIGDVGSTVVIRSKRWRKAELTKCVAHQWNGHRNYFNR